MQNSKKLTAFVLSSVLALTTVNAVVLAQDTIPDNLVAQVADTVFPGDVENLKATAGDKLVKLTWDAATDNVGVAGYRVYYGKNSVTLDGGNYTNGPVDAGNKVAFDVTGLDASSKYYFAVTAYDAAGNESENYSLEVSATTAGAASTPVEAGADKTSPKVESATSLNISQVKVIFSEAVSLPPKSPESAFNIKSDLDGKVLEVKKVELDASDTLGKTVLIETGTQKDGASYIVTAGIEMKDKAGNPIVSGTSDTALFKGKATPKQDLKAAADTPAADTTAPTYSKVTALDSETVEVTYSEPVKLSADPKMSYILTEQQSVVNVVDVKSVTKDAAGSKVTIKTAPLKDITYNLISVDVTDNAGNKIDRNNDTTTFKGVAAAVTTTTEQPKENTTSTPTVAQEAAENFKANLAGKVVNLSWKKLENVTDLANFVVYVSTDMGKTFNTGKTLSPSALTSEVSNLVAGKEYYFKLTSKNIQGVESNGLVTSLVLPETGPELIFLALGSLGSGFALRKRKK